MQDHLPLYRQAQIYSHQGGNLDRSTLAGWVGKTAYELRPVFDALVADLKRSTKLFMDETRVPLFDPGKHKTKTGYFWVLARDDRPWCGAAPSGVAFTYAPGRSGQYVDDILKGFTGILQVEGYAGYIACSNVSMIELRWLVGLMRGANCMRLHNRAPHLSPKTD